MERDRLAFLLERPSFSQEDCLPPFCIPNAPNSEVSPSPVRTPSPVTPIRLVTPPQSSASLEQSVAEEAVVFHTPPEHHPLSHLSSSEDQNQHDFCAEEPAAKVARVTAGEEFGGDTVSLGETEVVETEEVVFGGGLDDSVGNGGLVNDGVAKVDGVTGNHELGGEIENVVDIGGEMKPNDENGVSSGVFDSRKIEMDKSCLKVRLRISGFDKGVEITKNAEKITNDAEMQKDGHMNEGPKEKITKDAEMKKDGCANEGVKSRGKRSKKKARDAEKQKDGRKNEGVRSSGKRSKKRKFGRRNEVASSSGKKIVEIEEFRFVSEVDGKRRKLPTSLKGKEKDAGECLDKSNGLPPLLEAKEKDFGEGLEKSNELVEWQPSSVGKEDFGKSLESKSVAIPSEKEKDVGESLKKNSNWQDFMDLLKQVNPFLDRGNEDEDVDWLQTAKDRGLICVKYRIWE